MKKTTEEFIEQAKNIHGNKYDYSKVEYVDAQTKVCIICPEHGEFWQKPYCHLAGNECPKCANIKRKYAPNKKKNNSEFIEECENKYGNKYDYSKVEYINAHTKVCIIEKETGREFFITPTTFLTKGPSHRNYRTTQDEFIAKAKQVHGDYYDYSKVEYVNSNTKVCIICPKHGEFWEYPHNHLRYNCSKCGDENGALKRVLTTENFIARAKQVHGDYYDYSKVNVIRGHEKVCIICPKHGEFWQTPTKHLYGRGCPKCKTSKLEEKIQLYLESNNTEYIFQYSPQFLKNGRGRLKIDFYLPEYNAAIECQGIQHFISTLVCCKAEVEKNKKRDIVKKEKCEKEGIKLYYYTTIENSRHSNQCTIYNSNNLFTDINELFKKIKLDDVTKTLRKTL